MRVEPLGESAYILRDLDAPAPALALALQALPEVLDAIASYDTVGVFVESGFDPSVLERPVLTAAVQGRLHTIPVCYEMGEDLDAAAQHLGIGVDTLVREHASGFYDCFALGFCPGFAYLGYLPDRISGVPRLPAPRVRVEPGSVGITGRQTAVYPLARPGGWSLIGRTPLLLVDIADRYFPIAAGDQVRFQAIGPEDYASLKGERL